MYGIFTPYILYRTLVKGRSLGSWRQRFWERVLGHGPEVFGDRHCVWLHAVSVGEVNLLHPLVDELRQRYPDSDFVITTTTTTGLQLAKEKFPDLVCCYCPIDFSWAIHQRMRSWSPDLLFLSELEIWPNLIGIAKQKQIPIAVINGRLSEKSHRGYLKRKWLWRWFIRPSFESLTKVSVQNAEDADRFVQVGCHRSAVSISGSIKFDGAMRSPDPSLLKQLARQINLRDGQTLWVAGSTQDPEEKIVSQVWQSLRADFPGLRLVIVPRHPHRGAEIRSRLVPSGIDVTLSSENQDSVDADTILVADTIGQLTGWWVLSSIAFVGGSFGDRGGQNMIEPAAAGSAVCFGPNTRNFKQVVRLMLARDVAEQVDSPEALQAFVRGCLQNPDQAAQRGRQARQLVEQSQGALTKTIEALDPLFASESAVVTNSKHQSAA